LLAARPSIKSSNELSTRLPTRYMATLENRQMTTRQELPYFVAIALIVVLGLFLLLH
jgi:hypothetical protein